MSKLLFSNGAKVNQNSLFTTAEKDVNTQPTPRSDIPDVVKTTLTQEFVANMDLNKRAASDPKLQATTPSSTRSGPSI